MPRGFVVDPVGKALRRHAQIQRWRAAQGVLDSLHHDKQSHPTSHSPQVTEGGQSSWMSLGGVAPQVACDTSASERQRGLHTRQGPARAPTVEANATLQQALGAYVISERAPWQDEVARASSKEAVTRLFLRFVAEAPAGDVHPATFAAVASALLTHHVRDQLGVGGYHRALLECVGGEGRDEGGRWAGVTAEEEQQFVRHQATRLERYAARGTSFHAALGVTVEGADNACVALIEHQLRRRVTQHKLLPATLDTLCDLMRLDLSWSSALHIYNYAREMSGAAPAPPTAMTERMMSLMTGYRTNGLGTRPWRRALQLYDELRQSGYEMSLRAHTCALDALWRSGADFHKLHTSLDRSWQDEMWPRVEAIRRRVYQDTSLRVSGEEGRAFMESLVKASVAAGRWDAALSLLSEMESTVEDTSHRMLVPTAETLLFAMAACNAAGNVAHSVALRTLFDGMYTLRVAHPECLLVYLQSLRHVATALPRVAEDVTDLVTDGRGLDRPCAVACLQLLSHPHVMPPRQTKRQLASALLRCYDGNPWPQQLAPRTAELQTVFRCCHVIEAAERAGSGLAVDEGASACALLQPMRELLTRVYGSASPELRSLDSAEVHALRYTMDWSRALELYQRHVTAASPAERASLPVPLRQMRYMTSTALLRCCRAAGGQERETSFLLEDDAQAEQRAEVCDMALRFVEVVERLYEQCDDEAPHEVLGELFLLAAAADSSKGAQRQRLAVRALRAFALAPASTATTRLTGQLAQMLGWTELYMESVLRQGHAKLRDTTLLQSDRYIYGRWYVRRRFRLSAFELIYW